MDSTFSTLSTSSDIMLCEKKAELRHRSIMSAIENGLDLIPGVPIGSIFNYATDAVRTYRDIRFIQKLETFLFRLPEDIEQEKLDSFWENVGDRKQEVVQYLIGLLDAAETDKKADMMGCVYRAAVNKEIDHEEMLRLCDIIKKSFASDLRKLPLYLNPNGDDSITTQNLMNIGLIDNYTGGKWRNDPSVHLNKLGQTLYNILSTHGYFKD